MESYHHNHNPHNGTNGMKLKARNSHPQPRRTVSGVIIATKEVSFVETGQVVNHVRTSSQSKEKRLERKDSHHKPRSKCFSPEVLNLGRNQLILTQRSTADLGILPPKMMRFDDSVPNYGQRQLKNYNGSLHTSSSDRDNRHNNFLMPPPVSRGLTLRNSLSETTDMKIPLFSISEVLPKRNEIYNNAWSSGFPWAEWEQSNFCVQRFRDLLSNGNYMIPVSVVDTEDYVFVKFMPSEAIDFCSEYSEPIQKRTAIEILTAPLVFSMRAISGTLNWIIGN